MSAIEDLGKNRAIVWMDLRDELWEEAHSDDTEEELTADLDALAEQSLSSGVLYPSGMDKRGRILWRATDYKTVVFVIREFLATRRLTKESEVKNVRIQSGLPASD